MHIKVERTQTRSIHLNVISMEKKIHVLKQTVGIYTTQVHVVKLSSWDKILL